MNYTTATQWPYDTLSNPLGELREKIEDLYIQLRYHKPSHKETLDMLQQEMRTPIGNILASITLLKLDGALTSSQEEMIQIIEDSTDALLVHLNEMIDFTE